MMAEIDWPEQPLGERIALIRQEAARIGVTVEESRMVRQTTWIYPALKYRNISLDVALKYTADSTKLLYRVTDRGALRFFLNDDVDR